MVPADMQARAILSVAVLSSALLSSCSEKAAPLHTYPMGEKVSVGKVIYTVFETQWLTQVGTPPDEKIPQNRYYLVRVNIVNGSGADMLLPTLNLEDDKGESYPEVTSDIGAPQWIGALRTVHPADSLAGNLIFDVPPAHYKLRVTDDTGTNAALVDIPLSFTSETPDGPIPGESKRSPTYLKK
jgi:hypothetical protein